jgi:hypothetical protein
MMRFVNLIIEGLTPVYNPATPNTVACYLSTPLGTVVCTLNSASLTVGADMGITGVASGDLVCSGYAVTTGISPSGLDPVLVIDPGNFACLRVMACGCPYLLIRTDLGTIADPETATLLAKRLNNYLGGSQRSR